MKGPGDEAAALRMQYAEQTNAAVAESGASSRSDTAKALRSAADDLVGRQPRALEIPVLKGLRRELEESRAALARSWEHMRA